MLPTPPSTAIPPLPPSTKFPQVSHSLETARTGGNEFEFAGLKELGRGSPGLRCTTWFEISGNSARAFMGNVIVGERLGMTKGLPPCMLAIFNCFMERARLGVEGSFGEQASST